MRILPEWMDALPLQQQAVVILALRGPDGFPKYHPCKELLYYYRASILAAAHKGRHLRIGEHVNSLMTMQNFDNAEFWDGVLARFRTVEDELPLHFYTHLMHGAQVLAYKHPGGMSRARWFEFYVQCCGYLHVPIEQPEDMDRRLSDFGRELEQVLD